MAIKLSIIRPRRHGRETDRGKKSSRKSIKFGIQLYGDNNLSGYRIPTLLRRRETANDYRDDDNDDYDDVNAARKIGLYKSALLSFLDSYRSRNCREELLYIPLEVDFESR